MTSEPPTLPPTLLDQYRFKVVRKLAEGGMGSVYEAMQIGCEGFQKRVAIKMLLRSLCRHERFVRMFVQEAKLVANLVHENIVQIYQLSRLPDGTYYFVMEYVNGLSLFEFLQFHRQIKKEPPPLPLAVHIISRIARGLAYAHTRSDHLQRPLNIVHRDVCPNNILITTEGLAKLTDFGIAIMDQDLYSPGRLMGKLTYMAPEQALQQNVDFRVDIFSLGACLFELICLEPIRQRLGHDAMLEAARKGYVDWEKFPKELPAEIRGILKRCLAFDAAERYSTTDELARDLEYFIYKDGYGPTIQTVEAYLRHEMPYLYQNKQVAGSREPDKGAAAATIILDDTRCRTDHNKGTGNSE
ncbi:MAG: serine/threonine protein kinase [Lentisphaerae bacterium]|nr:MAG: serine/threonine protein kinase [Lentisphaerota bacterium]